MPKKNLLKLDGFWLRIIAMTFMVIDHAGVLMSNYRADIGSSANTTIAVLRALGRIAFPLFIFLMVEGMHYTRNGWKYLGRIALIYGLMTGGITIYIFAIARDPSLVDASFPGRNPFTDLILIAAYLFALNAKGWKKLLALLPLGVAILGHVCMSIEATEHIIIHWFPYYLRPDYGLFGFALATAFFLARPAASFAAKKACAAYNLNYEEFQQTPDYQRTMNLFSMVFYATAVLILWGLSYVVAYDPYSMSWESYCLLAIVFLFFYSGKRGYDAKWFRVFSYAFFPMHLIILFLIFFVSFGHV